MSVRKLKVGEFGRELYFNAGTDISMATSYTVEFIKPDGTKVSEAAVLGIVEVTVPNQAGVDQILPANEYAVYVVAAGLIDQAGRWSYKLLAPSATVSVPGACGSFDAV